MPGASSGDVPMATADPFTGGSRYIPGGSTPSSGNLTLAFVFICSLLLTGISSVVTYCVWICFSGEWWRKQNFFHEIEDFLAIMLSDCFYLLILADIV